MRPPTIVLVAAALLAGCGSGKPAIPRSTPEVAAEETRLDHTFGVLKSKTYTVTVTTSVPIPKN
jgi:hypothetical protein